MGKSVNLFEHGPSRLIEVKALIRVPQRTNLAALRCASRSALFGGELAPVAVIGRVEGRIDVTEVKDGGKGTK